MATPGRRLLGVAAALTLSAGPLLAQPARPPAGGGSPDPMVVPPGPLPPGSADPSPAAAGSEVIEAGRFATAQCQKPEPVGASGSKTVTAKLFVSTGKPDQESWGETSSPPGTPNAPEYCGGAQRCPSAIVSLVTVKSGTSGRRANGSFPVMVVPSVVPILVDDLASTLRACAVLPPIPSARARRASGTIRDPRASNPSARA